MVEGLCNSSKLATVDKNSKEWNGWHLSSRFMDELFAIEKCLGSVNSVVSFTFNKEEMPNGDKVEYEEFPVEEVVEKVV
jgi:hypothetical protein